MSTNGVGVGGVPLPEPLIWSCLTQLVSAIRAVHGNNLAVRTLQLNQILCTQENNTLSLSSSSSVGLYGLPKLRYQINCIGIVDILEFESRKGLEELQEMDMRSLGCILLSMTTGTEINCNDLYTNGGQQQQQERISYEYMKFVQQNYSRDLYTIVQSLLHPNTPPATIQAVASSMAMHAFDELDYAYICIDERHASLIGIYESGRALRLLLKLAFVNERPEFGIDTNWSESGDCYILKLFQDYGEHLVFLSFSFIPRK
jgi:PAB-dependent poly(A)-specific ribonuclease subunit 3